MPSFKAAKKTNEQDKLSAFKPQQLERRAQVLEGTIKTTLNGA